jgi:hypothetical protein
LCLQVWSGHVTWRTPDGRLSGSFAACGHIYPPAAAAAAAAAARGSSSSSGSYWSRYSLLPPALGFTVDVRAEDFEAGIRQQPPPAAAAAGPLSAGWDCCPLVLVPVADDDVVQMNHLTAALCNSRGDMVRENGSH